MYENDQEIRDQIGLTVKSLQKSLQIGELPQKLQVIAYSSQE